MLWDHAIFSSSISDNIFHYKCLCRLLVEGRLSSPQEVHDSIMLLEVIQPKNLDSYWKVYVYTKVVTVCILALEKTKNPETLLELANKVIEFIKSTGISIIVGHSHNTSPYNFVNNNVVLPGNTRMIHCGILFSFFIISMLDVYTLHDLLSTQCMLHELKVHSMCKVKIMT